MIAADFFFEKIEMKLYKIPFGVWSILFLLVCLERLPAQSFVPAIPSIVDLELRSQIALGSPDRLRKWTEQKLATANSKLSDKSILLQDGTRVRLVLLHRLLNSFQGPELESVLSGAEGQQFLLDLCGDDRLLKGCFGRPPQGEVLRVWPQGSLNTWLEIWKKSGTLERRKTGMVAAACALTLSGEGIKDAQGRRLIPSEVYSWFKDSIERHDFVVNLDMLTFEELCVLAKVPRSMEEMAYLRRTTKPASSRWETLANNGGRVRYTLFNKEGISVQDEGFYNGEPGTLQVMERKGGVCGAISTFGAAACRSRGVPATTVGQPGHCAFIWLNKDYKWILGNDVGGWSVVEGGLGLLSPWEDKGVWLRVIETLRFKEQCLLAELWVESSAMMGSDLRLNQLRLAVKACPSHPTVWRLLLKFVPPDERKQILASAKQALSIYPPEVFSWVLKTESEFK